MKNPRPHLILPAAVALLGLTFSLAQAYPVHRPPRTKPVAPEGTYTIHPDQPKQVIEGLGFENPVRFDRLGQPWSPR